MKNVAAWNVGALFFALGLATSAVWLPAVRGRLAPSAAGAPHGPASASPLEDHSGNRIPRATYTRIASLSTIADQLLLELCEPDRVVAFTAYSARSSTKSFRFQGKPTLEGTGDLEKVLTLRPDLVLVSRIGDPRSFERMREAGLLVYDLGEMHGLRTLIPNIHEVAAIVGHPERGDRFAEELISQMAAVGADLPPSSRKRGLYLSVYGGRLYGGSVGTSYHDVLTSAGLVEAAEGYRDWPEYSAEAILSADPDVIVTNVGMRPRICEHAGLSSLRACAAADRIVALDNALLGDPGPAMLDAAGTLRVAVYGAPQTQLATKGPGQ
jgi:iron complex transport system substrate-binding protein